jgi:hypothetical protein
MLSHRPNDFQLIIMVCAKEILRSIYLQWVVEEKFTGRNFNTHELDQDTKDVSESGVGSKIVS